MRKDVLQLLDDLAADERERLTSAEVRERLGLSAQATSNLLSRLVRDGFLDRVAPGVYAPRPLGLLGTRAVSQDPALAVGAAFGGEAHRMAYASALGHHGLLVHPVRAVQVAVARRVKIKRLSGRRLQAIFEPERTVEIGAVDAGHGARVSTVERALLESAGRSALAGGWPTLAIAIGRGSWNPERLAGLAQQMRAGPALRRVASLADQTGQQRLADELPSPHADARPVLLDPREAVEEAWFDRRWRVRWPVAPERAAEVLAA